MRYVFAAIALATFVLAGYRYYAFNEVSWSSLVTCVVLLAWIPFMKRRS